MVVVVVGARVRPQAESGNGWHAKHAGGIP